MGSFSKLPNTPCRNDSPNRFDVRLLRTVYPPVSAHLQLCLTTPNPEIRNGLHGLYTIEPILISIA
jgi:hypothetical protein